MPSFNDRLQAALGASRTSERFPEQEASLHRSTAENFLKTLEYAPPPPQYPSGQHPTYIDNPPEQRKPRLPQRQAGPSRLEQLKSLAARLERKSGELVDEAKEGFRNNAVDYARDKFDLVRAPVALLDMATEGEASTLMNEYGIHPDRFDDMLKDMYSDRVKQSPIKRASIKDRKKDLLIDALNGAIDLGGAGVGVLDLGFKNQVGNFLQKELGFSPKEAKEIASNWYSDARKAENAEVDQAQGFEDTAMALLKNPSVALGKAVNAAPITALYAYPGAQIALEAGGIQSQAREAGRSWEESAPYAVADGIAAYLTNKAAGGLGKGLGGIPPGMLELLPQTTKEQIFTNLALGRPFDENLGKSNAVSLVTGGPSAGMIRPGVTTTAPESTPPEKHQIKAKFTPKGNLRINHPEAAYMLRTQFPQANFLRSKNGDVVVGKRHSRQVARSLHNATFQNTPPDWDEH